MVTNTVYFVKSTDNGDIIHAMSCGVTFSNGRVSDVSKLITESDHVFMVINRINPAIPPGFHLMKTDPGAEAMVATLDVQTWAIASTNGGKPMDAAYPVFYRINKEYAEEHGLPTLIQCDGPFQFRRYFARHTPITDLEQVEAAWVVINGESRVIYGPEEPPSPEECTMAFIQATVV